MSNIQDIDIETECQYLCLDVLDIRKSSRILRLNVKYCLDDIDVRLNQHTVILISKKLRNCCRSDEFYYL